MPEAVFVKNRYVSQDTWYDTENRPFQPQVHYNIGGATKLYGAALYRLRREDFGELRHHDGLSPAWPIRYDDMEPYYTATSSSTKYTATTARTRPTPQPALPTRFRQCRMSPACSNSTTTCNVLATPSLSRPLRHPARRAASRRQHLHPLLKPVTAIRASCMPRRMPR